MTRKSYDILTTDTYDNKTAGSRAKSWMLWLLFKIYEMIVASKETIFFWDFNLKNITNTLSKEQEGDFFSI